MLTPHQRNALINTHHLSVTANAGSGKTRVLVERYMDLLLSGRAGIAEIVALTYTEKAASELKRKVAEQIAAAIGTGNDQHLTSRLEAIRGQLPSAFIGTIHSFCARILREYPVEAGVDAAFSVIEGLDQQTLLQDSIKQTFRNVLNEAPSTELREGLRRAVRLIGKWHVIRFITLLVEKREQVEHMTGPDGIYQQSDDKVLALWREHLSAIVKTLLHETELERDLKRVIDAAEGKKAGRVSEQFTLFARSRGPGEKATAYREMMGLMFRKDGGLYQSFGGKGDLEERMAAEISRLAQKLKQLAPLIPCVLDPQVNQRHQVLLSVTRTLLEIAGQALVLYEQKKLDGGQLDFEDLQVHTRNLLRQDAVRAQLSRRLKFVMIDEYQDTNQLQYDILLPLLTQLSTGNLFIVGDPKQSIYGFRNANVEVFERTKDDIVRVAGAKGDLVLEESFRPLRDIAAFVNLLFSRLMPAARESAGSVPVHGGYEVLYDPLVRARQNNHPGRVEVILRQPENRQDDIAEGEMIARRILQLHASKYQVFDKDEHAHDLSFKDIAVLLRSRGPLPEIEEAFIRHNIPYLVTGGVGYFQTQDIFDFYNYFQFLLNPADDVALAGILRSPFFSVSDAELFQAAANRQAATLWEELDGSGINSTLPPALGNALGILRKDLAVGLRLAVPQLIARVASETSYVGKISGTSRGAQALANFEKLQQMARSYEMQGFTNLYDFTQRLRRLIDEEENEGQGVIDALGNALQIMTIHAAKGLEFPVVIVPNLHRKLRFDGEPFLDDQLGMAFSLSDEEAEEEVDRPLVPLTAYLKDLSRRKSIAEEKRILYVACTRARDVLILSGDAVKPGGQVNCMRWVHEALSTGQAVGGTRIELSCSTTHLLREKDQFVPRVENHPLVVHLLNASALELVPGTERVQRPAPAIPRIMIDPLPTQTRGEIFSASKIKAYLDCPAKYYLRYMLGFPGGKGPFVQGQDEELKDREFPAELRGRLFHAVMQNIDTVLHDPELVSAELQRACLLEAPLGLRNVVAIRDEVGALVQSVIASRSWKEIVRGRESKTEFTISATLGDDYITGTLDRTYRDTEGIWNVVDYKTDTVDSDTIEKRAELYWAQVKFYALLVHRFFSASPVKVSLLFTSMVETPLRRTLSADDLRDFEHEITGVIRRIKGKEFQPHEPPCGECPLLPSGCPMGKK